MLTSPVCNLGLLWKFAPASEVGSMTHVVAEDLAQLVVASGATAPPAQTQLAEDLTQQDAAAGAPAQPAQTLFAEANAQSGAAAGAPAPPAQTKLDEAHDRPSDAGQGVGSGSIHTGACSITEMLYNFIARRHPARRAARILSILVTVPTLELTDLLADHSKLERRVEEARL